MALSIKPPTPQPPSPSLSCSPSLRNIRFISIDYHNSHRRSLFPITPISISKLKSLSPIQCLSSPTQTAASECDIEMVRTKEGLYIPRRKKVVVLWDLDNKPPRGPPYNAATALKRVAEKFGDVVEMSAYANRHAFIHLPNWVLQERRERRELDIMERKGVVVSDEPYICSVCGRKCKTNMDLKKHFRQLHERERQKKLNRMKQLKGKKRQKYKERYIAKNHKYEEAARELITPKVGYGLERELRRAGVFVKTVANKPQSADWALKRQMMHSMNRGIDWLFLVSDDSDFKDMLRKARESNLGTVVVGDWERSLSREADIWVSWNGVENGEIKEEDLMIPRRFRGESNEEVVATHGMFSLSSLEDESVDEMNELDLVVDELVAENVDLENGAVKFSAFSEGEEEDEWVDEEGYIVSFDDSSDGWSLDSDDEEE